MATKTKTKRPKVVGHVFGRSDRKPFDDEAHWLAKWQAAEARLTRAKTALRSARLAYSVAYSEWNYGPVGQRKFKRLCAATSEREFAACAVEKFKGHFADVARWHITGEK